MIAPGRLSCDEVRDLAPLFVTLALDVDEMGAVRDHLVTCAHPHPELAELGEAATVLLETVEPAEPSAGLRERLMAAAAADLAEGRHPARPSSTVSAVAPPLATIERPAPTVVVTPVGPAVLPAAPPAPVLSIDAERRRRRPGPGWLLAAAAVIVAIALGGWNLALQRDLTSAQAYRDGVNAALQAAGQPGSVAALLAGGDGSVSGLGVVAADGTVNLAMRGLTATSGSQVYTTWSIGADGKPISLGDFRVGSDGVAVVSTKGPAAAAGAVLALTLEPLGGAQAPAGPIVAKGVTARASG